MRQFLLPLLLVPLAGCGAAAGTVITGASLATYVHTDKFISDHIASAASDKDCAFLHVIDGQSYCKEDLDPEMQRRIQAEQQPYCYYTLGEITCYDTPDPYNNNEVPVR